MRPQRERTVRDQTIFYMKKSVDKLSAGSAIEIAQSPELREFLLFLANHGPKEMEGPLRVALKKASAGLKIAQALKNLEKEEAKKRAAGDNMGQAEHAKANKRTRYNCVPSLAGGLLRSDSDSICDPLEHRTRLSSRATPTNDSDAEGENGSGAVAQEGAPTASLFVDENSACQKPENDHQQMGAALGGDAANSANNYDVLRGEIAEDEASENEDDLDAPKSKQLAGAQSPQDCHVSEAVPEAPMEMRLTQGDEKTIATLRSQSAILRKAKTDAVFELVESLDFYQSLWKLKDFLRNRLIEENDSKKSDNIKSVDLDDPNKLYSAILTTSANTKIAKIIRAYLQMRLEKVIHGLAGEEVKLAARSAGNVSEAEKRLKVKHYEDEFYAGQRWTKINRWFGGIGFIIVVVTSGIGSQLIVKSYNDDQREALRELSQYLNSIKMLVRTLGPDCLDDICRYGQLPKGKIEQVEKLEVGLFGDEDGYIDEEDLEMDDDTRST